MTLDTTPKRPWTPEDDAKLAELKAGGRTDLECARMLNRTPGAVQSHRQWLTQQARKVEASQPVTQAPEQEQPAEDDTPTVFANGLPWTVQDDGRLAEYRRIGHEDEEIAILMGRTVAAVQMRISNLRARGCGGEIPTRKRPSRWTPERVAEARALRTEGMTAHQTARRLGTGAATVSRALRSPETIEDSPGEGVRVARTFPDLQRAEAEVEQARAVLARAQARHREAMEPIVTAVGRAVRMAGLSGPSQSEGDPVQLLIASLRGQGIELRVRT